MSALTLTLKHLPTGRLDLSPLTPALAAGGHSTLARVSLVLGNQKVALGDLFAMRGDEPADCVLEGDLSRVDGIGAGLASGRLRVEGDAGAYLGLELAGAKSSCAGTSVPAPLSPCARAISASAATPATIWAAHCREP